MTNVITRVQDNLAPSTQEIIHLAQQEAARMQSTEVFPEHLLLGVIRQDDEGVRSVLRHLGIDMASLRARVSESFSILYDGGSAMPSSADLPLSKEARDCLDSASSFASRQCMSTILPEHLLLGTLRHPRTQPLLSLLLPEEGALPVSITEGQWHDYTAVMDQLIHSRVRSQIIVYSGRRKAWRVLRAFERPTTLFLDIAREDIAKRALRGAVDFLCMPRRSWRQMTYYLYGVLLVGDPSKNRRLLAQAVAGEAVVPLISLSLSALVALLTDIESGAMQLEDVDLSRNERESLANGTLAQRGRRIIEHIFNQAREASPCVLFIDDIDAIDRLGKEVHDQWLHLLLAEMDGRDYHPPMVVIAAASNPDGLDQALLHPARFQHRVVLEDSFFAQSKLCPVCNRIALPQWKHCIYCGTSLVEVCPRCNAFLPPFEDREFCCECGCALTAWD